MFACWPQAPAATGIFPPGEGGQSKRRTDTFTATVSTLIRRSSSPRLCLFHFFKKSQRGKKTMSQDGNIPLSSHNIGLLTGSLFLLRIKDPVASGELRHIRKRGDILSIHAAHASLKSGCRARPT